MAEKGLRYEGVIGWAGGLLEGCQVLNKCLIIGNLGADPELRYTANGDAVATFSVATSRRWTTDGEQREETEWFRCVAWRRLAEVCSQYLAKGSKVYVEGRMQTRSWDGQDGQKHYMTELVAQEVKFLSSRQESGAPAYEDEAVGDALPF